MSFRGFHKAQIPGYSQIWRLINYLLLLVVFYWKLYNILLFTCPVVSHCSRPHEMQHARPPCPPSSPGVCPSSSPLHQWCHPAISSCDALCSFCPQFFPALGSFQMSRLFVSGEQNIGASASVLPMSIQGWFLLRLTYLISLLSKEFARVFSSTTVQRHQFFGPLSSLQSSSHNYTWPLEKP